MAKDLRSCDAAFCEVSNRNSCLALFTFPKSNPIRLEKWLENIKMKTSSKKQKYLCSNHFESSAFTNTFRTRLLPGAVPTIQIAGQHDIPYLNAENQLDGMQSKSKNFSVIRFAEENSFEVVPNTWLKEEEEKTWCMWPLRFSSATVTAYVRCEKMPESGWEKHEAVILHQSCSYCEAEKKLEALMKEKEFLSAESDTAESILPTICSLPPFPPATENNAQLQNTVACHSCKNIEDKLDTIAVKIDTLIKSVEAIKQQVDANASQIQYLIQEQHVLPNELVALDSPDELKSFDEILQDDIAFSQMVSSYGIFGGKDIPTVTRNILKRCISHDLSLELRWTNMESKTSIQEFPNFLQFIAAAVRSNDACRDASQMIIEDTIKQWLRYAKDQEGRRNKRRKC